MGEKDKVIGEIERGFAQILWENGMRAWEYNFAERKLYHYSFGFGDHALKQVGAAMENAPESIIESGIVHRDDADKFLGLYERIKSGEKHVNGEIRAWVEKRRSYAWIQVTATVLTNERDEVERAIFLSRDISDQKQLERRFAEESRYWEETSKSILATGRRNLATGEWEQVVIHGMEITLPEEIRKTADYRSRAAYFLLDVDIAQEDVEQLSPGYLQGEYARGVRSLTFEYNARTIERNEPVRIRVDCTMRKRPETGELIAFYYETDITQEFCNRTIMDSIMKHEYDLVGIIFAASNSIYSKGKDGERKTALPKLISNNYDEVCTRYLQMCGCDEDTEKMIDSMKLSTILEKLRENDTYLVEFGVREPNGQVRRKEVRYSYVNKEEQLIAISRRDIHDIVMAEKEKQEKLEKALSLAEKANHAKSEFLSRMSHEMRTPMNAITGLVALASQELDDKEAVADYLAKINVSGRHLMNLINDVLDMAKIESGRLELHEERCNYSSVLADVASIISPLCEQKDIAFVCEGIECEEVIMTDRLRFQQVLINLLSNAVKFTPKGGSVYFKHKNWREGDNLKIQIEVADSGIGMSEEFQKRMFQPFTQEESDSAVMTQGTGLGLAITKAIIDKVGGTIEVYSHVGAGTRFVITFTGPYIKPEENPTDDVRKNTEQSLGLAGKTILLVEDHPMNQLIARRILQNNDMNVITLDNGEEAVNYLREAKRGDVDAVLMDIRMPIMDGITATRLIRQLPQAYIGELPIIAMTANAFEEDVEATRAAGMNFHLAKPIEPQLLLQILQEYIGK